MDCDVKTPERWGHVFVITTTTLTMTVLGLWLKWVRETELWDYFVIYCLIIGVLIWKYWDYRPPPL